MRKAINSTKVHHCTHHDTLSKLFCLYQIHLTYLLRKERAFADKHPEFDLSFTTLKGCQASLYNSQFLKLLLSLDMEIRFRDYRYVHTTPGNRLVCWRWFSLPKMCHKRGAISMSDLKKIFSPSLQLAWDLCSVTDTIKDKLLLLNKGCGLNHQNDKDADLNYLVKK